MQLYHESYSGELYKVWATIKIRGVFQRKIESNEKLNILLLEI